MRCSLRYNDATAQLLEIVAAPFLAANASQAVPVTGGTAATLELQNASGVAIASYDELTPAWDSTRRRLYYSGVFPSASFPLGLGYRAIWRYIVTAGSSPELRQEQVSYFDVTVFQIRPVVVAADLYQREPRLQAHTYTNTAPLCATFIDAAWEQLYADVLAALSDTPNSLVDSTVLRLPHLNLALYQALSAIGAGADAEARRRDYDSGLRSVLATAKRDPGGTTGLPYDAGAVGMGQMIR